jgi:hypothetical protein
VLGDVGPAAERLGLIRGRRCHWVSVARLGGMGAERDREELARLVEQLPDEEVSVALAELRRRLTSVRPWPPAWFGIEPGDGSRVGAASEDILAEGFGR